MSRVIPGTIDVEGREFKYIECESKKAFKELFPKIVTISGGDLPKEGGAINEKAVINLPNGKQLHGLSYKGDLEGWRSKVIGCCEKLGILWGGIHGGNLKLSNGGVIPIDNCDIELF
jgi:hypothetical protein